MPWQGERERAAPESPSTVVTDVTRRDVLLGTLASMLLSPQLRWMLVGIAVFFSLLNWRDLLHFAISIVVYVVVGLVGGMLFAVVNVYLNPKLKRGVLGTHSFSVTDDGLLEKTDFNETLHRWPSLDRGRFIFDMVMIRISGSLWHIIPARSFASEAQAKAFLSSIQERIRDRG